MTATPLAQGTSLKCDAPRCNKPATVDRDVWSFCAEHANEKVASTPVRPARHTVVPQTAASVPQTASPAMPQVVGGGTIGLLLEQASGHSNARVRKAADRIETDLDRLRALIAGLADDERRKTAEKAAKEKARADIERLEQQLAAAKAALRGKATRTPSVAGSGEPLSCRKGCGRTSTSPAGRAAHERHCEATGG